MLSNGANTKISGGVYYSLSSRQADFQDHTTQLARPQQNEGTVLNDTD